MSVNISGTYGATVTLSSSTTDNPVTVTSTGRIDVNLPTTYTAGILGSSAFAWTITNLGTIQSIGNQGVGIDLLAGGVVTNGSAGSIYGKDAGIVMTGGAATISNLGTVSGVNFGIYVKGEIGSVSNFGTVSASGTQAGIDFRTGGSVTNGATASIASGGDGVDITGGIGTVNNLGTISASPLSGFTTGVWLKAGGSVTNGQSGSPAGLISGGFTGVAISGASGAVTNFGTITGLGAAGVALVNGGSVTNGHSGSAAGLISGSSYGVRILGTSGNVANFGTITASGAASWGVYLLAGGSLTNGASGSTSALISGGTSGVYIKTGIGTVTNLGTIVAASDNGVGVSLNSGGSVTNGPSASVAGGELGVFITGGIGTVSNLGIISGTYPGVVVGVPGIGIFLSGGGSVTNGSTGSIAGVSDGISITGGIGAVTNLGTASGGRYGVRLGSGGSVTNGASGSIDASIRGFSDGVYVKVGAGTVTNFGIVSGTGVGVEFTAGGGITNNRYALISGNLGISIAGGAGTVSDAGAISGGGGTAIQFGVFDDSLILDPTATFLGNVDGGAGNNTLELRAGLAVGTLNALGSSFVNFGHVVVDPGANWTIDVASLAAGQIIAGSGGASRMVFQAVGTLDLSGVSGFPTIVLAGLGASSASLHDANFIGLSSLVITVTGGDFGNTLDASALTGTNRIIATGGLRADRFTGGAGNDIFKFTAATLTAADAVAGGGGSDQLLMTTAGTLAVGGVAGVETFALAGGAANSLTLANANFTGVTSNKITVVGGAAGNTENAAALAATNSVVLEGGGGSDAFVFSAASLTASDVVAGGSGSDTLTLTTSGTVNLTGVRGVETYALASTGANTLVMLSSNFTAVTGNKITVNGGNAGNTIRAASLPATDSVVLNGGAGSDFFVFSPTSLTGSDVVAGVGGSDQLVMTASGTINVTGVRAVESYLLASTGANTLTLANSNFTNVNFTTIAVVGGSAGNTVDASSVTGANKLVFTGGAGADIVRAGAIAAITAKGGDNQFIFAAAGTHTIADFTASTTNEIAFSNTGFALGLAGATATPQALPAALIGSLTTGAFTMSTQRFAYNQSTGQLLYDAGGSSTPAATQLVATLSGDPALTAPHLGFVT